MKHIEYNPSTHARPERFHYYYFLFVLLYLDPLLVAGSLDDPVDIDAGYVDVLCSKGPNIHHLFHLHRDRMMNSAPSPIKCLVTLEIKDQIRKPCTDVITQPGNNFCLHGYGNQIN